MYDSQFYDTGYQMTPEEDLAFYGPEKRPDFAARAMAVLNRSVAILVPNYTVTIATMEELCIFFLKHTGVLGSVREIKETFEEKNRMGINDRWMQKWREAIQRFGPLSKTARVITAHNKVPLIGRTEIAKALAGVAATLNINYVAMGSGVNVPADGDTTLQTELFRGGPTSITYINNVVYIDTFFGSAQAGSKTLNEIGLFMNGTGSANSGILLSRVNIAEVTGANETMSINATITLTSAT